MTPLHVVMKQRECSPVSLEICRYLCHEIKIDSCLKDCDGKIAEDYCRNTKDERLVIINETKYSHPVALEEVQKEEKFKKPSKKVKEKDKEKREALPKLKTEQTPCQQANNSPSTLISPPPISEHDCIIKGSGDDDFKQLMQDLLSQDETYFVYKSKRQGADATREKEIDSEDETNEDTEIQLEPETKMKYDVFCSPRVKTFIETGDPKLVSRVISTMKRLACGETSVRLGRKMHSKITDTIFHGNVDSAKRIIWHRTVSYSPISRRHCEILVLLDVVLDHKKLNKATKNAENWIKRGEEEGGKYAVKLTAEGTPSFYEECDIRDAPETVPFMMKDDYGAVPIYSLPEYVLQTIRAGISRRLGLPLKLSREEHDIVYLHDDEKAVVNLSYQKGTILLVGRSGTGKTTCCLSRMWEEFRHYWEIVNDNNDPIIPRIIKVQAEEKINAEKIEDVTEAQKLHDGESGESCEPLDLSSSEPVDESATNQEQSANVQQIVDCDHLHQVFVTKSPYLCREVKHRFFDLVSSHNLLQKHKDLEHALPTSLNDVSFPLFVTSRDLLMLMDSTLRDHSFFHRKNGKLLDRIKNSEQAFNEEDIGLLNDTDDEDSDSEDDDESDNELEEENLADDNEFIPKKEVIEVTASLFQKQIWEEMSTGQKKIDPILVWQEIKSFIKGSVTALKSEQGHLSKEEYFKIGRNKAPNFVEKREDIHALFLKYQKFCKSSAKKGQKYFDECDLLHHLYHHRTSFSCTIHNFYIDEVQDFTEAELYLLLNLSHCPNGNFLCGDSAQSIMRGVSFRFTDVRSLFHELDKSFQHGKVVDPGKPHYLTINYRAHAGILSVADSVIELLDHFFKNSFDNIPQSNQNISGQNVKNVQKPLLLHYDDPDELTFMLAGNQFDGGREIEFGAHQAVIVPSKETEVPESLKKALVFTVLEAKGLEFNDVLLYNFFSESKVCLMDFYRLFYGIIVICHSNIHNCT